MRKFWRTVADESRLRLGRDMVALLASVILSASGLFAQSLTPPPMERPPWGVPEPLDSEEVGYMTISVEKKVAENATYPYDELAADIARWQDFIEKARQIIASVSPTTDAKTRAQAERLKLLMPTAEAHLATLKAEKKLQENTKDCGLSGALSDWANFKEFVELEHQRLDQAAAMARMSEGASASAFSMMGGAAGASLNAAGASIMQRQMENDDEFITLSKSRMDAILDNCINQEDDQKLDDFKRKLAAANPVAEQAARDAEALAGNGQFDDVDKIAALVMKVLLVSRANQLMGYDDVGEKQQKATTHILQTFVENAARTCGNQSFSLQKVYGLDRQSELLGTGVDLSFCENRLFEASGLTNELLPYRVRHCGPRLEGTWKMQVTRGNVGGSFGKLEGETEIPQFGNPAQIQAPGTMPLAATYWESGDGPFDIDGRIGTAQVTVGEMRVSGTMKLLMETDTMKPGVAIHNDMKMHVELQQQGFNATPNAKGGMTTHYPGGRAQSTDLPVKIINKNRPCDPNKDIWSYSTD